MRSPHQCVVGSFSTTTGGLFGVPMTRLSAVECRRCQVESQVENHWDFRAIGRRTEGAQREGGTENRKIKWENPIFWKNHKK